MIVAFISDVHGNLSALEAVLGHLEHADHVLFCGDAVGYGEDPEGVCSLLRQKEIPSVRGNHDAMVIGDLPVPADRDALYKTSWTRGQLSHESIWWLQGLPIELEIHVSNWTFRVRHASPWDLTTYLYPDSPLLDEAMPSDGATLVLGHTHYPFVRAGESGNLVNCGSVGFPRGGAPGAQFTMFNTDTGTWVQRTVLY